jgi:hypothetical protein
LGRRLPVIQTPASEDQEAEQRPAAEWVLIGCVLVLALFFPLSALGIWLGSWLSGFSSPDSALSAGLRALPILAAFGGSAAGSGALLGRFALRASPRAVLISGALGGATIVLLASFGGALRPIPVAAAASVLLIGGGACCAGLGARFGRSRRPGAPRKR